MLGNHCSHSHVCIAVTGGAQLNWIWQPESEHGFTQSPRPTEVQFDHRGNSTEVIYSSSEQDYDSEDDMYQNIITFY